MRPLVIGKPGVRCEVFNNFECLIFYSGKALAELKIKH
jgi:hypothetical protein